MGVGLPLVYFIQKFWEKICWDLFVVFFGGWFDEI
jgi:hypothetical protein